MIIKSMRVMEDRMNKSILVTQSSMPLLDEYVDRIKDIWDNRWLTNKGKFHQEFEAKLIEYLDISNVSLFTNGHMALEVGIESMNLTGEVITTPFTFAATANSVLYSGAKPVFADIDPKTFNLDAASVEEKITDKTKAILPVHLYGQPADMDAICEVAQKHDLKIIEDAAQAHGAVYKGKKIGSIGDLGCFSFYPTKNITTGEGGMVTTNNEELAEKAGMVRAHGESQRYEHEILGYNYRMTNVQAALGVAQMEELPEFIRRKQANYDLYCKLFEGFELGKMIGFREGTSSNKWFYSLEINRDKVKATMREIITALEERGVQTRAIWGLINEQVPYQGEAAYKMEKAPYYAARILNFPSSTQITKEEIEYVAEQIKEVLGGFCVD